MRKYLVIALVSSVITVGAGFAADEGAGIVARHKAVLSRPPTNIPSQTAVDGPLMGNGDTLAALGGLPDKLSIYINKNDLWLMKADSGSKPQPLGKLDLCFPDMTNATFRVEQNFLAAVTTGRFETSDRSLKMETGVMATDNLLWIRLETQKGLIRAKATLNKVGSAIAGNNASRSASAVTNLSTVEPADGMQVVERRITGNVMAPAGAVCVLRNMDGGESFTLEPGKPVVLVALIGGLTGNNDYRAETIARAKRLTAARLAGLRKEHGAWWRGFWNESYVEIPDKVLEQRYYLSQYVLASASRLYDFPPGIFGWVTTDNPSWRGDYHLNYNHVAPFYGLYAANHLAQADPCHGPILANLEKAKEDCRHELGVPGVCQRVGIGPKGAIADVKFHGQKSNSAYSCVPLAFRWYATYDPDFGRKAYPFVRETATFWENWLKFENGRGCVYG